MKDAYEITSVTPSFDIGQTPARINYRTGALYVNAHIWGSLSKEEKQSIISHELGHVALKTKDEIEADTFALDHYRKTFDSSKGFVKTYTKNLNLDNPAHKERIKKVLVNSAMLDYKNGQKDIVKKLVNSINKNKMIDLEVDDELMSCFDGEGNLVDFSKAFKNRMEKKVFKAQTNQQVGQMKDTYGRRGIAVKKHEAIDYKRMAKGDQFRAKGEAGIILANQGIQQKSATGEVFSTIVDGVKSVMGKSGQESDESSEAMESVNPSNGAPLSRMASKGASTPIINTDVQNGTPKADEPKKDDKTMLYVGIAVAVVVLGGMVAFFMSKK